MAAGARSLSFLKSISPERVTTGLPTPLTLDGKALPVKQAVMKWPNTDLRHNGLEVLASLSRRTADSIGSRPLDHEFEEGEGS